MTSFSVQERLGIHWAPKKDLPSWDERYEELKEYKKTHGNTNVPTSGLGLGSWVRVQRTCMKKNKLAQDKVDRLVSSCSSSPSYGIDCRATRLEKLPFIFLTNDLSTSQ